MTSSISDAVIVGSTVDLGRNLGLRVVAEGVENAKTWQELNALGCDAIKGYYVSPPIAAEELSNWLRQSTAIPNRHTSADQPWHNGSRAVPAQGTDPTPLMR